MQFTYSLMQLSLPNAHPGKKVRLEESSNKMSNKTAKLSCVCNLMDLQIYKFKYLQPWYHHCLQKKKNVPLLFSKSACLAIVKISSRRWGVGPVLKSQRQGTSCQQVAALLCSWNNEVEKLESVLAATQEELQTPSYSLLHPQIYLSSWNKITLNKCLYCFYCYWSHQNFNFKISPHYLYCNCINIAVGAKIWDGEWNK